MRNLVLAKLMVAAMLLLLNGGAFAAPVTTTARHAPLPMTEALQDKNFYLLSAIKASPELGRALSKDATIEGVRLEREHALTHSRETCHQDPLCVLKALLWTEEETHAVAYELSKMISVKNSSLHKMVLRQLRPSGAYEAYAEMNDADLLAMAWQICAGGLNEIVSVYGLGQPGRYPLIDAASLDPRSPEFREKVGQVQGDAKGDTIPLFFEPALPLALKLLALNHRDEAARFEPMEEGANRAALKALPGITWKRYPYTVIVVPGAGGGSYAQPLTDAGRERVSLAAKAFHEGKAPIILVSGGYVHPAQTTIAEAEEMKKALMTTFQVPEAAILIDPHARHTTTNLRNAAREIFRYRIPMQQPALAVSGTAQITYIYGEVFRDRCLREMGYVPFRNLARVSETGVAFTPVAESLEQDPIDPLDP